MHPQHLDRDSASVDVLVVGAGPIGLEVAAAVQLERRSVLVVDAGAVGETIVRTFPPRTRFFTSPERLWIAGLRGSPQDQEKITGEEYLAHLRSVVLTRGLNVRTGCRFVGLSGEMGRFTAVLRDEAIGREHHLRAGAVVLATGGTDTPRRLGVPGEGLGHVCDSLGDPHRLFGRRVLVVGGRNSAAESALRLYRVGAHVSLSYRRPFLHERVKHWIRPEVEALMDEGAITRLMPTTVTRIEPDRAVLRDHTGDSEDVVVDDVLLQLGYEQDGTTFDIAGVDRAGPQRAPAHDAATMQTNRPGVFVAGTATAGTQQGFSVFIESSHQHADRISAALAGRPPPPPVPPRPRAEA